MLVSTPTFPAASISNTPEASTIHDHTRGVVPSSPSNQVVVNVSPWASVQHASGVLTAMPPLGSPPRHSTPLTPRHPPEFRRPSRSATISRDPPRSAAISRDQPAILAVV